MISISIKSEIDSRSILYPLMRCLRPLGNILVITSNKQVTRIIDGEYSGDFRNFNILYDIEGGTDELLYEMGIDPEDYAYVVYDNVGILEQNKLIIGIGPIISEEFEAEMMYLGEDKNTHILRYGKPVNKAKKPVMSKEEQRLEQERKKEEALMLKRMTAQERKEYQLSLQANKSSENGKKELTDEEIDEAVKMKFQTKKEDVFAKLKKLPNLQFPKLEDLEFLESNKQFFNIDKNFITFFYAIFQPSIGIKESNFVREVTRRDESSSDFSQRPASGENSIKFNAR